MSHGRPTSTEQLAITQAFENHDIGDSVLIAGGEIEASVLAYAVYAGGRVLAQCVWWNSGQRYEQWLDLLEVQEGP